MRLFELSFLLGLLGVGLCVCATSAFLKTDFTFFLLNADYTIIGWLLRVAGGVLGLAGLALSRIAASIDTWRPQVVWSFRVSLLAVLWEIGIYLVIFAISWELGVLAVLIAIVLWLASHG